MAKSSKPKPPETRKPLGPVATKIRNYLATHHVKLFSTDVPWKQRILDAAAVNGRHGTTKAVCSTTIDGDFALTLAIDGTGANVANALTLELDARTANALHYARDGDVQSMREMEFSEEEIEIVLAQVQDLEPVFPDTVDRFQKQVFLPADFNLITSRTRRIANLSVGIQVSHDVASLLVELAQRVVAGSSKHLSESELVPLKQRVTHLEAHIAAGSNKT
jgi:hypothetical protein